MAVTPATIATALGKATPIAGTPTFLQWEMWIDDAEMLIEDRRVELSAATLDATKLDYVVREAVVAHARKPDDATTVTIAVDDASTSRRYESGKGRVSILDDWWAFLGLLSETGGAFTIRPVGVTETVDPFAW